MIAASQIDERERYPDGFEVAERDAFDNDERTEAPNIALVSDEELRARAEAAADLAELRSDVAWHFSQERADYLDGLDARALGWEG